MQAAVADGQVILATRVSGVSPDQGQLAATLDQARATVAKLGIEERIELALADAGYWLGEQIRQVQDDGIRLLVPPRAHTPKAIQPEAQQMRAALDTDEGKQIYKRRAAIVEPVFAQIRHNRGITRLLGCGHQAVQAEIDLIATTHNLLKLSATNTSPRPPDGRQKATKHHRTTPAGYKAATPLFPNAKPPFGQRAAHFPQRAHFGRFSSRVHVAGMSP